MSVQSIGYQALLERYSIKIPQIFHISRVGASQRVRTVSEAGVEEHFPAHFARDDSDVGHLIFALKYDGVELLALRRILERIDHAELESAIKSKPTSKYLRRLWFFWEWFHPKQKLAVPDCPLCNTIDLVEPREYYTRDGRNIARQRIRFNLLGNSKWCPMVRRSEALLEFQNAGLKEQAEAAANEIPSELLHRAIRYLYTKETRSSYEIEGASAGDREEKFVELLLSQSRGESGDGPWWDHEQFGEVQRGLLDARYASGEYRKGEVRVSELRNLSGARERVHWVGAPQRHVVRLMEGLSSAWQDHHLKELPRPIAGALVKYDRPYGIRKSSGDPFLDLVVAACLSFGFVYIHPFDDGNGRTHRLLLHYVLNQTAFTPKDITIPISSTILHDAYNYDRILESYSAPALRCIDHNIDPQTGESTITNDCADLYQYVDFTVHVEQLCAWLQKSIKEDLIAEIATLQSLDAAQKSMQRIVDMPDKKMRLFLSICMDNGKHLGGIGFKIGKKKRASLFAELEDREVEGLEDAIAEAFDRE